MSLEIVTSTDPLFDQLKYLHNEAQKGQYVTYQSRLFLAVYDNGLRFVEVDPTTPDPHDPSGRWGKYAYLGDPDERSN